MRSLLFYLALSSVSIAQTAQPTFPALEAMERVEGVLVKADFVLRTGGIRTDNGSLIPFALPPYGIMRYKGCDADLRDVPLGTKHRFLFLPAKTGETRTLVTTESDKAEDSTQKEKFIAFTKARGIAGVVDKTEGSQVTVTFFSGNPVQFKKTWLADFQAGKSGGKLCVANDELRTWNPPVDGEGFSIIAVNEVPVQGIGSSGVQLVVKVSNMLEGFRRGRTVRVFAPGWKAGDQYYGESLMGYGFGRMLNQELVENVAKEYPEQFPFRTDFCNSHLPWYQLKQGVKPPLQSEHVFLGELTEASSDSATLLLSGSGEKLTFDLLPKAQVFSQEKEVKLQELPRGLLYRCHLYQNEAGPFTHASYVSDDRSWQAKNAISYRIKGFQGDALLLEWMLPLVKDYNGDMQRPQPFGHSLHRLAAEVSITRGSETLKPSDLKEGMELRFNSQAELPNRQQALKELWLMEPAAESKR
jgi:hypothetical protein